MNSKSVLRHIVLGIREILLRNNQLTLSGLGTLIVESIPSKHKRISDEKFLLHPPKKRVALEGEPPLTTDEFLISELASNLGVSQEDANAAIDLFVKEIQDQIPIYIPELGIFKQLDGKLEFQSDPELEAFLTGAISNLSPLEIKKSPSPITTKHQRKFSPVIIAIPAIIAVGIGGYLVFQNNFSFFQGTSNDSKFSSLLPSTSDSIFADSTDNINPTDTFDIPLEPNPERPSAILDDIKDPLATGTPSLNRDSGGYTLIIGSFNTSEQASNMVDQFRKIYPRIPIGILRNHDNTLYRVAIGQNPTIPEALALKERLTELPAETWVLNILNTDL